MGCSKFRRLAHESLDRVLAPREDAFMAKHRGNCKECRASEAMLSASINLLRQDIFEVEPSEHFNDRLVRRIQLSRVRSSSTYWLPALVGALIGAIGCFGLLQLVEGSSASQPIYKKAGEARRVVNPDFAEPQLILPPLR